MFKTFRYLPFKDWIRIAISGGLIVLQVWLEITLPQYTQALSSSVAAGTITMGEVWRNGGWMLACAGGSMLAAILCGYFIAHVAADFAMILRKRLFDRILEFGDEEFNRFGAPSLITRMTNDVVQMQMLIATGLQVMVKAPVTAVWAILKISVTNLQWTAAAIITVVVIIALLACVLGLCYPKFKQIQKITDRLNEVARENMEGMRVIHACNAEKFQEEKFETVNHAITKNHLFTARTMGLLSPVMTLCMNGLSLAIYWIAAILLNSITGSNPAEIVAARADLIGEMTAFSQYALQIVGAFLLLIVIFSLLPKAIVSGKRVNEVLETAPSVSFPQRDPETKTRGELEFCDVSFGYPGCEKNSLEHISFRIRPGETFAVIGATGSGKSTLINLISRSYDVTQGEILLDGNNLREYSRNTLFRKISIAPQNAALMKGDIKSNVTYGTEESVSDDDPRLIRALEIAQADFAEDEKGIHAEVAQDGANFSGGQRQRLSIARAVFRNAEIVLLDDSFSALDDQTDLLVRNRLRDSLKDVTVVIAAQRIGTIRNADRILVLDQGKTVGLGTHEELLRSCAIYRQIARAQHSEEGL